MVHNNIKSEYLIIEQNLWVERKSRGFFIEKKLFYTTGHQRRLKELPWSPKKPEDIDIVKRPRLISCRFTIKVMFMGIITQPLPIKRAMVHNNTKSEYS